MMRPIAISLSPNTEGDDISLAWHILMNPTHWYHLPALIQASSMVSHRLSGSLITLTSSGRNALHTLLKAHKIGKGDEVIIQAYTCLAVPEPILWTGATPIYADIAPRTYNIDPNDIVKKITSRTKAIIIQHTFGIPGPIEEVKALAKQKNILFIEDCAHALGATYKNQPVGTWGDAAFLSFGRDKTISSVYGGAIATKDTGLHLKLHALQQELPTPPFGWIIQQLLHPIIFYFALPLYFKFSIGQRLIQIAQHWRLISKAVTQAERAGKRPAHMKWRYAPALAFLLQNQIAKIEEFTERRRTIAQKYFTALGSFDFSLPKVADGTNPNWLRFPILVKNRDEFLRKAREHHMMLGDWYDAPLVPKDYDHLAFKYTAGSCPNAENAASHTINLPTYPLLTDAQVDRIIEFTKQHALPHYVTR